MKIIVMGAGVIGVTCAYELLRDGHEVEIVERESEVALAASYANAGLIAPSHSFAWASPKVPKILLKSLYRNDQAFRIRPTLDPEFWRWTLKFLSQCTSSRARLNTGRKLRLAGYAQERLHTILDEVDIDFDRIEDGIIFYYRSPETLKAGIANSAIISDAGREFEIVDAERIAELDPVFEPVRHKIAGGIYSHADESGNSNLFTQGLAAVCRKKGAKFHFDTTVERIVAGDTRVEQIVTSKGAMSADAYVLSLGVWSPLLTRSIGLRLPVYPVKGYSMTAPVAGTNRPPRLGAVDEDRLLAYCPMGDTIRFTSTAQFSGYDLNHKPSDFANIMDVARDILPHAADYSRSDHRACLRPMTPEGTPVFGTGRLENLHLNTGHGHMGWTMACGAARIAADLIAGKTPAIPLDGMTLERG